MAVGALAAPHTIMSNPMDANEPDLEHKISSPLIEACIDGKIDVVDRLLAGKSDVEAADEDGSVSYTHLTLPTILLV